MVRGCTIKSKCLITNKLLCAWAWEALSLDGHMDEGDRKRLGEGVMTQAI